MPLAPPTSRLPPQLAFGPLGQLTLTTTGATRAVDFAPILSIKNADGQELWFLDSSGSAYFKVFDNNGTPLILDAIAGHLGLLFEVAIAGVDQLDVNNIGRLRASAQAERRLELSNVYAGNPTDPPLGAANVFVIDLGATQFLRVRYNDGGVMRVGDLALV